MVWDPDPPDVDEAEAAMLAVAAGEVTPPACQPADTPPCGGLRLRYRTLDITGTHTVPFRDGRRRPEAMGICQNAITD